MSSIQHCFVPSAVDIEKFKPIDGIEMGENRVISINSLYDFKGKDKVLNYVRKHKELKFDFYGREPEEDRIGPPRRAMETDRPEPGGGHSPDYS